MIQYRVRARPLEGEDIVMELFEAKSDAEQYYDQLQEDSEDNIINAVPYKSLSISMEEFVNGVWTYKSRKLVTR